MRKLALVLAVAFSLTACVSVPNPITGNTLDASEIAFDASLKTFNELKALCANRTLPPACRTYVIQGQAIIKNAAAADIAARNFVRNNPNINPTSVVTVYSNFVSDFQNTVAHLTQIKGS